jgi:hypothetical protein
MTWELSTIPGDDGDVLATSFTASVASVRAVLDLPEGADGRSEYRWIRLANGDLILGVFPTGDGYFAVETNVEDDYRRSLAATAVDHPVFADMPNVRRQAMIATGRLSDHEVGELLAAEAALEAAGGRGVELAETIDRLRSKLGRWGDAIDEGGA